MNSQHYIVFDLETQRSIQEVSGRSQFDRLGVSVAVLFDSATGTTEVYREEQIGALIRRLQEAPLIVGFNVLHFDYAVLAGYGAIDYRALPTVDLMQHVVNALGFRLSLDNLIRTTLGAQKSGTGLQALQWYREGNWEALIAYCRDDVLFTRDLYEFGKQNGHVLYFDAKFRIVKKIKVSW